MQSSNNTLERCKMNGCTAKMSEVKDNDKDSGRRSSPLTIWADDNNSPDVFQVPGWSNGDFTRTRKLGLWNIARMLEHSRLISARTLSSIAKGPFQFKNTGDLHFVMLAQKTVIYRDLYRLSAIHCPMLVTLKIGNIGRTSMSTFVDLLHEETGLLLARTEQILVYFDHISQKAHPLPECFETLKARYSRDPFAVHFQSKPDDPAQVYVTTFKIVASDMDDFYHTNHSTYYRFTMDATYEAWKAGFLQSFKLDVCSYEVKSCYCNFLTGTVASDTISVSVWKDKLDELTLHFEIRKVINNAPVVYQTIVFYPLTDSKL